MRTHIKQWEMIASCMQTTALGRTAKFVPMQGELRSARAHGEVPEPHAPVTRTRYNPLVVVRHGDGAYRILQLMSITAHEE
jgi:hypothetical protein